MSHSDSQQAQIGQPLPQMFPTHTRGYSGLKASGQARQHNGDNIAGNVSHNHYIQQALPSVIETKPDRKPNRLFTGQEDVLQDMETCLLGLEEPASNALDKHYVLSGIGGVGKSEIALQFANRHRQEFWGVFWIDCSTPETIHRSFGVVASRCCWGNGAGIELTTAAVRELSNSQHSWLLVLDNCDDRTIDFSEFIPNAPIGTLLVTTRLEDVRTEYGVAGSHRIEGLGKAYAMELLFKAAGKSMSGPDNEREAAKRIVEQLGCHTLAVTVAASLAKKKRITFETYSKELGNKFAELLRANRGQAKSTYGTIEATFDISAQRLLDSGEACDGHALEILNILAFLDRTDVREEMFTRAWKWGKENRGNPEVCEEGEAIDFDIMKLSTRHFDLALSFAWADATDWSLFKEALARLDELALVSWTANSYGTTSISMHPVIQSWARNRLQESARVQAWQVAAAMLALSVENTNGSWTHTQQLQSHLRCCNYERPSTHDDPNSKGFLSHTLRFFWWHVCRGYSDLLVLAAPRSQRLASIPIKELARIAVRIVKTQVTRPKLPENRVEIMGILQGLVSSHQRSLECSQNRVDLAHVLDLVDAVSDLRQYWEDDRISDNLFVFLSDLPRIYSFNADKQLGGRRPGWSAVALWTEFITEWGVDMALTLELKRCQTSSEMLTAWDGRRSLCQHSLASLYIEAQHTTQPELQLGKILVDVSVLEQEGQEYVETGKKVVMLKETLAND